MLETTSQITFWRPCRENNVVNIQWHIACECEIMSIWGGSVVCSFTLCSFESLWLKVRRWAGSLRNGQPPCPYTVIDPHRKPHENYSNEPSDLNVNWIPAGEPAYLTVPLGVCPPFLTTPKPFDTFVYLRYVEEFSTAYGICIRNNPLSRRLTLH